MGKMMLCKAGEILKKNVSFALVMIGWLSFIGSYLSDDPIIAIFMQAIARVLP